MDTTKKLKALIDYCESKSNCSACKINHVCTMGGYPDGIQGAISSLYDALPATPPITETTITSAEDGTAARATHYLACPIQPIDLIQYTLTKEELIGFLKGNIIKYSLRAGHKGDPEKDKAKALQYKKWLDTVLVGDLITV